VDRADVVKAEEAALEQVVALSVLPVDPPVEVDHQLVEDPADDVDVAAAVDREHLGRRPRLHRRGDIAPDPPPSPQGPPPGFGTTPGTARSAGTWRTPDRRAPAPHSGTPDPTRRTTDTPTCPAST